MHHKTLFAAFSTLFVLSVASAHADLEASSIEDGATITALPSEITLTFTEGVELEFSTFKLHPLNLQGETGDDHTEAAEGEDHGHAEGEDDHAEAEETHGDSSGHAELDAAAEALVPQVIGLEDDPAQLPVTVSAAPDADTTIALDLEDELAPGPYVVMWRVLSADGHTIEGFLTFTYALE